LQLQLLWLQTLWLQTLWLQTLELLALQLHPASQTPTPGRTPGRTER
jgi:hypothetical protein